MWAGCQRCRLQAPATKLDCLLDCMADCLLDCLLDCLDGFA
jgi:hypothetical protein